MFANTQMLGTELSFPDVALDSTPAPAPVAGPMVAGNTSWMDTVLSSGPAHGSWVDAVVPPGPQTHAAGGGGMAGFGGMLGALSSFLPQIVPAVAGGLMPGAPRPSPVSAFQRDTGIKPSGELSGGTADSLRGAHGS